MGEELPHRFPLDSGSGGGQEEFSVCLSQVWPPWGCKRRKTDVNSGEDGDDLWLGPGHSWGGLH